MRVLHVIPTYLPARRYGGPVFATHALCAALAAQGCEVTVATTSVDGAGDSDVPVDTVVAMDGVRIRYFRSPYLRRVYFSPNMASMLNEECGRFDLLHLHSVFLWPTWAAARRARRAHVPYILSPRGMLVKELIERKSPWAKWTWIALIERANIERAAAIHVTSTPEAAALRQFGFTLPAIHEVANGVTASEPGAEPVEVPGAIVNLLASARPVVLYLGRINWKKGLDRLIPAMAHLPEASLLVVGNDEEDYTASLNACAVREGVADRVVFAGPLYGAAKAELFRRVAVLALPSYSENFGNVVLEAMSEGCAVVVTPEVGAAGIVTEAGGGLVARGDPLSFAAAIRQLLADPARRADHGRRGRDAMRARYSWDAVAARMMEVYRSLLAAHHDCRKT